MTTCICKKLWARWLGMKSAFAIAVLLGISSPATAVLLTQYNPTGLQISTTPLAPSVVNPSITAGNLTEVGFGGFFNTNVLPVGFISPSPTINLSQYLTFTLGTNNGSSIDFDTLLYSKRSYRGNGGQSASIRSSLDSFTTNIDTLSVNPVGDQQLSFNLSSLAPTAGPVTFRLYFYNAPPGTGNDWDDLVSTASGGNGLRVNGTFVPEPSTLLLCGLGVFTLLIYSRHRSEQTKSFVA